MEEGPSSAWHLGRFRVKNRLETHWPRPSSAFLEQLGPAARGSMDHLFISYAIEDAPLARWLTLKLTIEGYRVWCFEFQMLGGERFPKEIDAAIKTRTFRMLGLISHASIQKDNPIKEWTLAQAIGKERGVDFLVPLNVDGVKPTELPWTLSDTNWISFSSLGWAGALRQLFKLLDRLQAPKSAPRNTVITPDVFLEQGVQIETPETLVSNSLRFRSIPPLLREYKPSPDLTSEQKASLRDLWAFFRINDDCLVAFGAPPEEVPAGLIVATGQTWDWQSCTEVEGVNVHNLVSNLLRASVSVVFLAGGCRFGTKSRPIFFPGGLYEKDRLPFVSYKGRRTYVATKGRSTFYRRGVAQVCNYYLAFRHNIIRDATGDWLIYLKLYLRITDPAGHELEPKPAMSRRKAITRGWWNDKLLNRYLALCTALGSFQQLRRFRDSPDQVVVDPALVSFTAPGGINEDCFKDAEIESDDDGAQVTAELATQPGEEEEDDDEQ